MSALERTNGELQSEVLRLRKVADEARSEAEAASVRAELARTEPALASAAPAVRDGVPNPLLTPIDGGSTQFGKYQARVAAQQAEIAQLKAQIEHMSMIMLSPSGGAGGGPRSVGLASVATSPMKPPLVKPLLREAIRPLRPGSGAHAAQGEASATTEAKCCP